MMRDSRSRPNWSVPSQCAALGGSAWEAAVSSFVLFALGAVVPILPFLVLRGTPAVASSAVLSALGLWTLGAAITIFTGTPVWRSGGRQLVLGLAAAGLTFGIGKLIGIAFAATAATSLGVISGNPKTFIVCFLTFWYVVVSDHGKTPAFDFAGFFATPPATVTLTYAAISIALLAVAEVVHRARLRA